MKTQNIIIIIVIILSTTWTTTSAQEPILSEIPSDVSGVFVQTAPDGALVDRGNGTHILVMSEANLVTNWQFSVPEDVLGEMDTALFSRGWRGMAQLTTTGILEIREGVQLRVVLATPFLNSETNDLTYTVTVEEVIVAETEEGLEPGDVSLNRSLTEPKLTIDIDPIFLPSLQEGIDKALENQRECVCPPGVPGIACEICQAGW